MAVRRPLKLDVSNNLREMSDADITSVKDEMIRQYAANPSITLTVGVGNQRSPLTGSIDPTASTAVVGVGTLFTSELAPPTTNLFTNVLDMSTGWTLGQTTINAAGNFNETAVNAQHYILQNYSVTTALDYTQSFLAKQNTHNFIQIAPSTGFDSANYVTFNLADGTKTHTGAGTSLMTDEGDGWYRCSLTIPATSTSTVARMVICLTPLETSAWIPSYLGVATQGVFLKDPQIEQESFPTRFVDGTRTGDKIVVSGETREIATITDDTHLTVTVAFTDTANDTTIERVFYLEDTRLQAGTHVVSDGTTPLGYQPETVTPEPTTITVKYDKLIESFTSPSAPTDTSNKAFPVYLNASNNVQAMSLTDMYDTFTSPVIDLLTTAATGTNQAGTYRVHTATTLTGYTLISVTPIFVDTRADTTLYTAAGIPETLDQPTTVTNYYLFSIDSAGTASYDDPLYITAANELQEYTAAAFKTILQDHVLYYTTQAGSKIEYDLNTSSTGARGSAVVDTKLNGAGAYATFLGGIDDYRAQEFPNGTATTVNTYYLTCNRT